MAGKRNIYMRPERTFRPGRTFRCKICRAACRDPLDMFTHIVRNHPAEALQSRAFHSLMRALHHDLFELGEAIGKKLKGG